MIELNQLEQLIAIAKNQTLSQAAKELLISQPALSRSMQRLEETLEAQLFDRYKNKVVLNENGKLAVKYAHKILAERDKMVENIQKLNKSFTTLTLASCTPAPIWDIEPLINSTYPEVKIESKVIDKDILVPALKNQEFQLIISPFEIIDKDIACYPYLEEDLYLSIPDNHPLKDKKEVSFSDLANQTMLLYANIGFWYDLHIKKMPKTKFLIQNERSTFNEIIRASTLPSFTSNLTIKREGKVKNRINLPITDKSAHVTFYLALLKSNINKYLPLINKIENYYDF